MIIEIFLFSVFETEDIILNGYFFSICIFYTRSYDATFIVYNVYFKLYLINVIIFNYIVFVCCLTSHLENTGKASIRKK